MTISSYTPNPSISAQLFHFTGFDKARNIFKPAADALKILQRILQSRILLLAPNKVYLMLPEGIDIVKAIDTDVHMACLTETPLEFIGSHIAKYGKFGLGFKIGWALRNGGQNVVYCDRNSPNSYTYLIAEIAGHFARTDMTHNIQLVKWVAGLAAITENFELRDEREWRFLRAPMVVGNRRGVEFFAEDLETVICPKAYISNVNETLKLMGFNPKVEPTENYWTA